MRLHWAHFGLLGLIVCISTTGARCAAGGAGGERAPEKGAWRRKVPRAYCPQESARGKKKTVYVYAVYLYVYRLRYTCRCAYFLRESALGETALRTPYALSLSPLPPPSFPLRPMHASMNTRIHACICTRTCMHAHTHTHTHKHTHEHLAYMHPAHVHVHTHNALALSLNAHERAHVSLVSLVSLVSRVR